MCHDGLEVEVHAKLITIECKSQIGNGSLLEVDDGVISLMLVERVTSDLESKVQSGLLNVVVLRATTQVILVLIGLDLSINDVGVFLDLFKVDLRLLMVEKTGSNDAVHRNRLLSLLDKVEVLRKFH